MKFKEAVLHLLEDIRFWIILFFILHLVTITLPPLESISTWRQTDGLMIARNFYERNHNILYPTTDVAGEKSGIVGCEFPLLNYLIYLLSVIFGYHSWYGRLINLIVSSIGVFFFYKLVKDRFGKSAAFNGAIIILSSIWFTYNRTNIPDTFALSLCLVSLYCALRYLEKGSFIQLLLFFLLGMLGCLAKISAASLLTLLIIPFLFLEGKWKEKILLSGFAAMILIAVCAWYFFWVPYLNQSFGLEGHFFMGMSFADGVKLLMSDLPLTLKRFYDTPFKYIGFTLFLASLYFVVKKKKWLHLAVFLVPGIVYSIIVIKVAVGWHIDAYYVIMFIPPMAFVMGWGLSQIKSKVIVSVILLAIVSEGIGNQHQVFRTPEQYKPLKDLELVMDSVSEAQDLIAINGIWSGDPTPMYMAHRRGWVVSTESLSDLVYVQDIKSKGCKYIVLVKQLYGDVQLDFPKVYESEYFNIYDIR